MSRHEDAALLKQAVSEAAALAFDWFGRRPESWEKSAGEGPVSEADLAVDTLLRERLTGARPDYGWLSEETADAPDRLSRRRVWIVDPIDGTAAFLKGGDEFMVCAALVEDGAPVLSALTAPARGQAFFAAAGQGAFLNDERLDPPRPREALEGARFFGRRKAIKPLEPGRAGRFYGSLAYRLCAVAMGEADGAVAVNRVHEWDAAPPALIATELGLSVTDGAGAAPRYNAPDPGLDGLICAAPALTGTIAARFAALRRG